MWNGWPIIGKDQFAQKPNLTKNLSENEAKTTR
jgi:hypothetical protein